MLFDGMKWYKRTALLYAIGTWTLVGSCVYYTFYKCNERVVCKDKKATPKRTVKSSCVSAEITCKERFIPYSSRFLEFFRPQADDASGNQNDEK